MSTEAGSERVTFPSSETTGVGKCPLCGHKRSEVGELDGHFEGCPVLGPVERFGLSEADVRRIVREECDRLLAVIQSRGAM